MNEKIRKIFISTFILLGINAAAQQQVTIIEATSAAKQTVAIQSYNRVPSENPPAVYKVNHLQDSVSNTLMYEVLFTDGQAVLLSGSKACLPILGYTANSDITKSVFDKDAPCGLKILLDIYKEQIDSCFAEGNIPLYHADDWAQLQLPPTQSMLQTAAASTASVGPLLSSKWGQSRSNTGNDCDAYNYYATSNSCECINYTNGTKVYTTKSVAGCGAVAMAQIMNYWKHPVYLSNLGNNQFDWCNMVNELRTTSVNYNNERIAVARLIKKCGDASNTSFACSSSSGSGRAASGLESMGLYASHLVKALSFSGDWKDNIRANLNKGRPVLYGGNSFFFTEGHNWVIDGYKDDKFYMNWGWRGTDNGLFSLNDLTPEDYNYNYWQDGAFNIFPKTEEDYCDYTNSLASHYKAVNSPTPYTNTPNTFTTLSSVTPADAQQYGGNSTWYTIPSGATAEYIAHNEVVLREGFTAVAGANFTARIEPCANCPNVAHSPSYVPPTVYSTDTETLENETENQIISIVDNVISHSIARLDQNVPNPFANETVIGYFVPEAANTANIRIYDVAGRILSDIPLRKDDNKIYIQNTNFKNGMYFYLLFVDGRLIDTKKMVVK